MFTESNMLGTNFSNKYIELKSVLETAKLNDLTINDDFFKMIFDRIYEEPPKTIIEEKTTKTMSEKA